MSATLHFLDVVGRVWAAYLVFCLALAAVQATYVAALKLYDAHQRTKL